MLGIGLKGHYRFKFYGNGFSFWSLIFSGKLFKIKILLF